MDNKIADVKEVKAEATAAKAEDKAAAKKPGRKTGSKSTTAAKKTVEKKTTAAKKTVAGEETKKKTAAKAAKTTKKTAATKTEAAAPAKKSAVKPNVVLQYADKSVSFDELIQNAKNVWEYDMGRKPSEIKELNLYVKPEEGKVYFVVNGTDTNDFAL